MSLEAYTLQVENVLWDTIPGCELRGDQRCIFSWIDTLIDKGTDLKAWEVLVYLFDWKIHYSDRFFRKDWYLQTLRDAEALLITNRAELEEDLFQEFWVTTQMRWGKYYYDRGDWQLALQRYGQATQYLLEQPELNEEGLALTSNSYISIGVIHRDQGAFDLAHSHFLRSIDLLTEKEHPGLIAIAHKHLGDLYVQTANSTEALGHYKMAIAMYEQTDTAQFFYRDGLGTSLLGMATALKNIGDYEQSLEVLEKARKTDGNSKGIDYNVWFHLGQILVAKGEIPEAYNAFYKALERRVETFGYHHYKTAEVLTELGKVAALEQDWACAVENYQAAMIALVHGFEEEDPAENPLNFGQTFIKKDIVPILNGKIDALYQWAKASGGEEHLRGAWAAVQAAIGAINLIKQSNLQSEEEKLHFFRESAQIFERGIQIAWELGPAHHEFAFELAEQSKAIVLLEAFRSASASRMTGIPDSLLEQEQRIKYELSVIEDALFRKTDTPDLRNRLLQLQADYQHLMDYLALHHPEYYRMRYDNRVIGVSEIRSLLTPGQALVSYFLGDQSGYVFLLSEDQFSMQPISSGSELEPWVYQFREGIYEYFLSDNRSAQTYETSARQYVESAYALYEQLLAPLEANLPEELLIITDGILGYIPFEALLTAPVSDAATHFKSHPYLLRSHRVSYCYSATLWQEMLHKSAINTRLAAFAPAFPNTQAAATVVTRASLDTLYFNQKEVHEIASTLRQPRVYTGLEASKTAFLKHAPEAGILHIASHGLTNDTASGYSFVAFTHAGSISDSSLLYARELYTLRLQAAMVVLSACETGIGALRKGEGIISLARAFAYAGAASVISTLWAVNDASTTQVMLGFYKSLRAGHSKSAALRRAKIQYLGDARDNIAAHPYYWSAYIAVGDVRPLYRGFPYRWLVGVGLLLLVGVFLFRKGFSCRRRLR